jgi:hypothetical protein
MQRTALLTLQAWKIKQNSAGGAKRRRSSFGFDYFKVIRSKTLKQFISSG